MASNYIGVVAGAITNRPYLIFDPDSDDELDNPRLLDSQNENNEPVKMIKIDREAFMACLTIEQRDALFAETIGPLQEMPQ